MVAALMSAANRMPSGPKGGGPADWNWGPTPSGTDVAIIPIRGTVRQTVPSTAPSMSNLRDMNPLLYPRSAFVPMLPASGNGRGEGVSAMGILSEKNIRGVFYAGRAPRSIALAPSPKARGREKIAASEEAKNSKKNSQYGGGRAGNGEAPGRGSRPRHAAQADITANCR